MFKSTQLGEVMETCCNQCHSRFRITEKQLKQAYGKVCCGECGLVFNALIALKSYEGKLPPGYYAAMQQLQESAPSEPPEKTTTEYISRDQDDRSELSLHEAMYGSERRSFLAFSPLLWFIGILLLVAMGIAQVIYYQRYQLVENQRYQQQVINLCELLPCAESEFSSTEQIKLLERNVFTHPVIDNALMVSGSFVNQAPFAQKLPDLLISLFDVQGKLIANRRFTPTEYLQEVKNRGIMQPGKALQFRLEILDPGTAALTYEFEFY